MAKCSLGCEKLRLVDRCVNCNPGYGDHGQAYRIYRATRWGGGSGSLEEAEQAEIERAKAKRTGRQ